MITIDEYIENHTTKEDDVLVWLRRKTNLTTTMPRQLSGPIQGKLLEFFSRMINPEKILEIGTFTGYSAYCLSKGLKNNGELHTIEIKDEMKEPIEVFFQRAGIQDKVKLHIGDAVEIVKTFAFQFDMAFIDGDKRQYPTYYEEVFDKIKSGGYILIDNVLWYDKVITEPKDNDTYTKGIQELNNIVQNDTRVENVLLPLRDGLMVVRKL